MKTYLIMVESQGAYAAYDFTDHEWRTTESPASALEITARNALSAINKFARQTGVSIRYRHGASITDRNLHSFTPELLSDVLALSTEQEAA